MVQIIDGKAIAQDIKDELKAKLEALQKDASTRSPGLAVILVGDDPASHYYVNSKQKNCHNIGFESFKSVLAANASKDELLDVIKNYNNDEKVDGILLQLPLPESLKPHTQEILDSIDPNKDVDGLHSVNFGRLMNGYDAIEACTPKGCMELLKRTGVDLTGKKALMVGRSQLVGKPLAEMMLTKNATVTIAHSKTKNLEEEIGKADILIAAIGKKEFIKGEWIKPGAVVIDVGINEDIVEGQKKKLFGDVEFETAKEKASAITPVPGGVGPMTIAMLLVNTWEQYQKHIS